MFYYLLVTLFYILFYQLFLNSLDMISTIYRYDVHFISSPFYFSLHIHVIWICPFILLLGSRCSNAYQQQDNPEEFARWIVEELRTMSAQRQPMYENLGAADRGRGQYGDRVDGSAAAACTSAYCKHRQDKSPVQQFLPPPPASPRQRQPSPSARMSAPSPSPCASSGPGQGSSPWTPTTPRKRKRGTNIYFIF